MPLSFSTLEQSSPIVSHRRNSFLPSSREVPVLDKLKKDHQTERTRLLTALRGQTIRIPDLAVLFNGWPTKTNPKLDRLRRDVRKWLNE